MFISKAELKELHLRQARTSVHQDVLIDDLQKLCRRVAQLECPHTVETTDYRIGNSPFRDRWIMFTCVTCGKQRYETWAGMPKKKQDCFIKNGNVPPSWKETK